MSGAKNVIDMRPSKGFSPSQGNEHLRRLDDCERAQKARWNYDPSREHLNFEVGKGGIVVQNHQPENTGIFGFTWHCNPQQKIH